MICCSRLLHASNQKRLLKIEQMQRIRLFSLNHPFISAGSASQKTKEVFKDLVYKTVFEHLGNIKSLDILLHIPCTLLKTNILPRKYKFEDD